MPHIRLNEYCVAVLCRLEDKQFNGISMTGIEFLINSIFSYSNKRLNGS